MIFTSVTFVFNSPVVIGPTIREMGCFRSSMESQQIPNTMQAGLQEMEGWALREQHKDTVQTFDKVRTPCRFSKL